MLLTHRALRRLALPWLLLALHATSVSAATLAGGLTAGTAYAGGGGGNRPGRRWASIDLPVPGGP